MSLAQLQSNRLRNAHRLAGVGDAQGAIDALEKDLRQALTEVLKKHDLKLRDLNVNLSLSAGAADPYGLGGRRSPAGFLTAALDVA